MSADTDHVRLDQLLVERGYYETRSRARDAVKRGAVRVAGRCVVKPGLQVEFGADLDVADPAQGYVSRGALKLLAALDAFGFDPSGRVALDLGASTGGFTQVLLERAAARVYAVDIGRSQLDTSLAADLRVVSLQGVDARALGSPEVPEPVGAMTADVSFISLIKALPAALRLACPGCWLVALVKPQFEAGPGAVGKGGVVRDEAARAEAVAMVRNWLGAQPGWRVTGEIVSPIEGQSGNREVLLGARFDPQ